MGYKVLYRKYRPDNFNDITDQKFIINTLKESIINNKISHAYIFSGPKGTGKTTTAKVFAKAINCENPINGEPCNKCNSCINFDSSPDIIELDAASNNKVEDIREIINNVKLSPSFSKYKIYIIDEAHMLTNSASNAFLLTLEEPPSHVVFILATTNPENLPSTILSRCQHFAFSKISNQGLINRIKYVCDKESININDNIIEELASLSDGGLRDALSMLDQLQTINKNITSEMLIENFGLVSDTQVNEIISSFLSGNIDQLCSYLDNLSTHNVNLKSFINKFIKLSTNKICSLQVNNDQTNLLKKLIYELIKLNFNNSVINLYDLVKIAFISNIDSKNISQEIKFNKNCDENQFVEDIIDKPGLDISQNPEEKNININLEKSVETDKKNINNNSQTVDNKNDFTVQANINNDFDSYIAELKKVRINNSFYKALKKYKNDLNSNFDKFTDLFRNNKDVYSLILDTKIGVVSEKNAIFISDSTAAADLLNRNILSIDENSVTSFNLKVIFVSDEEWKQLMEDYKKKSAEGYSYSYIEEPIFQKNDDSMINLAKSIFSDDIIEVKEI